METSRKKMKEEAVSRLLKWGLHPNVVREFKEEDKLNRSEGPGLLYWLTEEEQQMVKEFEETHNKVVYHLIKTPTNIGLMYSILYVGADVGEWTLDNDDLAAGQQLVYVKNMDADDCSEFGSIGIKRTVAGGLERTW